MVKNLAVSVLVCQARWPFVSSSLYCFFVFIYFYMLELLMEYFFLTTFYGLYFNHQLHITLNNFFHVSWWPLHSNLNLINYLFSLKNSHPCGDLNPGPPRYQADMLLTELSWFGSNLFIFHFYVKFIYSMPPCCAKFPDCMTSTFCCFLFLLHHKQLGRVHAKKYNCVLMLLTKIGKLRTISLS